MALDAGLQGGETQLFEAQGLVRVQRYRVAELMLGLCAQSGDHLGTKEDALDVCVCRMLRTGCEYIGGKPDVVKGAP